MIYSELIKILTYINDCYPGKFNYPNDDEVRNDVIEETWLSWLKDFRYETVMMVLRDYLPKNPVWPPTPMQIKNRIEEINKPQEERITPEEAWEKALSIAIGSSYYDSDGKIMDERGTPERIRRTISAIGGLERIRCSRKDDPFFRKAFIDTYNSISERIAQEPDKNLIEAIREDVKEITNNMRILKQ